MTRLPDWEARLLSFLYGVRQQPYDPVAHNCAIFIRGVILAVTGEDAAARLGLELPDSEAGVVRVLARLGGMRGMAEKFFGVPAGPVLCARRGDIVIARGELLVPGTEDRETLGVAEGGGALCLTPQGLWRFNLADCLGAWSLG